MATTLNPQTEAELVAGVAKGDPGAQRELYNVCRRYFRQRYRAVFFANEYDSDDIFQNTYITLWENIERGKLTVQDGQVTGRDGKPLVGSVLTYMMSIARYKYMEWARQEQRDDTCDDLEAGAAGAAQAALADWLSDDPKTGTTDAIAECVATMPKTCCDILTKFYYEEKKLDQLLDELPAYSSKNALKSNKNRCLDRLRAAAKSLYETRMKH